MLTRDGLIRLIGRVGQVHLRILQCLSKTQFDQPASFHDRETRNRDGSVFRSEIQCAIRLNPVRIVDLLERPGHRIVERVDRQSVTHSNLQQLAGPDFRVRKFLTTADFDQQNVWRLDDVIRQRNLLQFARQVVSALCAPGIAVPVAISSSALGIPPLILVRI